MRLQTPRQVRANPVPAGSGPAHLRSRPGRNSGPGLPLETTWRGTDGLHGDQQAGAAVRASRWIDASGERRRSQTTTPDDRHVLAIALRQTRIRLTAGQQKIFDGVMAAGTVQLTDPGETLVAEFDAPCDFIHLHLPRTFVAMRGADAGRSGPEHRILRDPLAAQLARSLADKLHAREPLYAESIARTLLLRLAACPALPPKACPLPGWRLKRVQDYLEANLAETLSLTDLARVAGLSRSYFAAQFRVTTGYPPHDYIVGRRVELATAMLAGGETPIIEIALAVGFQTQAHFSTVFKRCTGTTPGRWRLTHRAPADGVLPASAPPPRAKQARRLRHRA